MPFLTRLIACVLLVSSCSLRLQAQAPAHSGVEKYLRQAKPICTLPLTFPGPMGGLTFVELPTQIIDEVGDTTYAPYKYLVDLSSSGEGTFLPPDTMRLYSDYLPFVFKVGTERFIHSQLAPSVSRVDLLNLDTNFNGVLGYAFFKKFVTVFDFEKNTMTLYPMFAAVNFSSKDTNVLSLEYKDDAILTYCDCPYPSVWLEGDAPPFSPGRLHLGFANPLSEIYMPSLDKKTLAMVERETETDSLTGKRKLPGFELTTFRLGKHDIASRSPRRAVRELPAVYKDLNIPVLGSIGTDVLRTFSALIFDPSRMKITFVKR